MKICLQLNVNDEQYFPEPREETYRILVADPRAISVLTTATINIIVH